jgi:hypothetical protein
MSDMAQNFQEAKIVGLGHPHTPFPHALPIPSDIISRIENLHLP